MNCVVPSWRHTGTSNYAGIFDESCIKANALRLDQILDDSRLCLQLSCFECNLFSGLSFVEWRVIFAITVFATVFSNVTPMWHMAEMHCCVMEAPRQAHAMRTSSTSPQAIELAVGYKITTGAMTSTGDFREDQDQAKSRNDSTRVSDCPATTQGAIDLTLIIS